MASFTEYCRLRTTQIKLNVSRNFTEMELRKLFRKNIEELVTGRKGQDFPTGWFDPAPPVTGTQVTWSKNYILQNLHTVGIEPAILRAWTLD
jgi:hypothetical protein